MLREPESPRHKPPMFVEKWNARREQLIKDIQQTRKRMEDNDLAEFFCTLEKKRIELPQIITIDESKIGGGDSKQWLNERAAEAKKKRRDEMIKVMKNRI